MATIEAGGAAGARGVAAEAHDVRVGLRLRAARERAGITLREVARRTGLSPSFLSQLEHDLVSPSISSLKQVAGALGVRVADLLAETAPSQGVVVRRTARPVWRLARARYEQLAPVFQGQERHLQPQLITFEPGGSLGEHPVSHPGEEFGFVLSGRVECAVGDDVFLLDPGDSVCFDAELPHRTRNAADGESAYLLVVTPPSF